MRDKQLLINEINKIYEDGNTGFHSLQILDIINEMKNDITSKKLLIKNDYGLVGNLLYKYRFDEDIYEYIYQLECESIINILKEGDNYIDYILYKNKKNIVINENYTDAILKYINDKILEDRKMVLEIVKYHGNVLEYVQNDFQNDKEVVYEAVKQNRYALNYASKEIKKDKEFILKLIKTHGEQLKQEKESNNEEKIKYAAESHGTLLNYIDISLKQDINFIQEAIKLNPSIVVSIPLGLQTDKKFILKQLKDNKEIYEYLISRFKNDQDILEIINN